MPDDANDLVRLQATLGLVKETRRLLASAEHIDGVNEPGNPVLVIGRGSRCATSCPPVAIRPFPTRKGFLTLRRIVPTCPRSCLPLVKPESLAWRATQPWPSVSATLERVRWCQWLQHGGRRRPIRASTTGSWRRTPSPISNKRWQCSCTRAIRLMRGAAGRRPTGRPTRASLNHSPRGRLAQPTSGRRSRARSDRSASEAPSRVSRSRLASLPLGSGLGDRTAVPPPSKRPRLL